MQTVTQKTLEDTMYYRDIPVFVYKINYPSFTTTCNETAGRNINAYYANRAMDTEKYCRNILFAQAAEDKRYQQDGLPFNSYTLEVVYQITYNAGCITSLYTDIYTYMGGALGRDKADIRHMGLCDWESVKTGRCLPAYACFFVPTAKVYSKANR